VTAAEALLAELRAEGYSFRADHGADTLYVSPPTLSPELRSRLKAIKSEVLEHLAWEELTDALGARAWDDPPEHNVMLRESAVLDLPGRLLAIDPARLEALERHNNLARLTPPGQKVRRKPKKQKAGQLELFTGSFMESGL
jgi:hypothetical protein